MDIWHSPITGACPCNLPAIGTLTHQIHSLIAGEEYYLSTQLTSKYGKKGPIRTIIQSTYTDDVIFDDTTTTLTSLDLLVQIESGVGNQMWVDMTPELGGVTGELYKDFKLASKSFIGQFFTKFFSRNFQFFQLPVQILMNYIEILRHIQNLTSIILKKYPTESSSLHFLR